MPSLRFAVPSKFVLPIVPLSSYDRGLAIPPGVPVLDVLHTSFDTEHQPFEVTRFVLRADLNGLDYQMSIED